MTGTKPDRSRAKSLTASIIAGMILVPLSAIAAVLIVGPDRAVGEPPVTSVTSTTVTNETVDTSFQSDLEAACGAQGTRLVELETKGSATEIQQAALDALRPICESAGLPLPPGPERVEPSTETVYVQATPTTAATVGSSQESEEGDHWEDDDHGEHHEADHEDSFEEHEDD